MKRPQTTRSVKRSGDIRGDLTESQLAWIGSVTIAYNEVETLIDVMLSIVVNLSTEISAEITSRINGVDGKIEIVKIGYKLLRASDAVTEALAQSFGNKGFALLKKYRDGVIRARVLDAPHAVGITIAKRGKFDEILLTSDALEGVYNRLVLLRKELIELIMILSPLVTYDRLLQFTKLSNLSNYVTPKLSQSSLERTRKQIERDIPTYLSQHQSHLKSRLSLPPLPEFPDESEGRPHSEDFSPAGDSIPKG